MSEDEAESPVGTTPRRTSSASYSDENKTFTDLADEVSSCFQLYLYPLALFFFASCLFSKPKRRSLFSLSLLVKAEKKVAERRKARAEARALRLQEKLVEVPLFRLSMPLLSFVVDLKFSQL